MRLNVRIEFYRRPANPEQDAYGQADDTESLVGVDWARMSTTLGDEKMESGQIVSQSKTKFAVRYRTDIQPATHTIRRGDVVYEITSVREIMKYGREKYLEILTEQRDNA